MTTYSIELNNAYANVEFDVLIDEIQKNIHVLLQTVNNCTFMSVFVDNEQIGIPFMCFPNQLIIPYPYIQEILGGNFIFKTDSDNYPNYEDFGKSCNLYFITQDEI